MTIRQLSVQYFFPCCEQISEGLMVIFDFEGPRFVVQQVVCVCSGSVVAGIFRFVDENNCVVEYKP